YAGMRAASALRSFYFFQRIERLEIEARRVIALVTQGGANSPIKTKTVADVTLLRRDGEVKSYIDLFFLAAVVLLCVARIIHDYGVDSYFEKGPLIGTGAAPIAEQSR